MEGGRRSQFMSLLCHPPGVWPRARTPSLFLHQCPELSPNTLSEESASVRGNCNEPFKWTQVFLHFSRCLCLCSLACPPGTSEMVGMLSSIAQVANVVTFQAVIRVKLQQSLWHPLSLPGSHYVCVTLTSQPWALGLLSLIYPTPCCKDQRKNISRALRKAQSHLFWIPCYKTYHHKMLPVQWGRA